MERKEREMYSEVYSILQLLDPKMIERLPLKLFEVIKTNRLESYAPKYVLSKSLLDQGVKRETLALVTLLQMSFWCDSEEEKNLMKQILKDNSKKKSQKMHEKFSQEDAFKSLNEAREKMKNDSADE